MKNWDLQKIGNVFTVSSGGTPIRNKPEYYVDGNIPWVKTGDLKGKYVNNPDEFITEEALKNSSAKLFPEKTVLLAMYGATIGACSILPFEAATNQACAALLPSKKCDEIYLYYFLKSFQDELIKMGVGGAQPNISSGKIKQIAIPLPPLDTQKKIAAILDAADAYRQKTKTLIDKYDQLAQSLFLDMFGDPVKNEKGWEIKVLEDICDVGSSRRVFVNELVDSGIPFYRGTEVGQLGNDEIINPSLFITKEHYEYLKTQTGVPKVGDLLMPSICPDGRIFRVVNEEPFYFKDGRVLWIKVDESNINSPYLKAILKVSFQSNYASIASGTTFAELKIIALKKIEILFPPLFLQTQFAERIQLIEAQKQQAQASLQKSEDLFNSLLQRAFKGELVS